MVMGNGNCNSNGKRNYNGSGNDNGYLNGNGNGIINNNGNGNRNGNFSFNSNGNEERTVKYIIIVRNFGRDALALYTKHNLSYRYTCMHAYM